MLSAFVKKIFELFAWGEAVTATPKAPSTSVQFVRLQTTAKLFELLKRKIAVAFLLVCSFNAYGAVTVNIAQSGSNVVVTANGRIKLPPNGFTVSGTAINPGAATSTLYMMASGPSVTINKLTVTTSASSFPITCDANMPTLTATSTLTQNITADDGSPGYFNVQPARVYLPTDWATPSNYIDVAMRMTIPNKNFTQLGVADGKSATCTWGAGTIDETIYVKTNSAPSRPTVTGITPSSGTTAGGTSVSISGTDFNGTTGISFGGAAATGWVVNNAYTGITINTPPHAAGAANVVVTTVGGTTTESVAYTYVAPAPLSATQSIASKALATNVAATSFTPVTGAGGTAPLAYTISPALPTGLAISSSTGAITGTPTATSSATNYTVTVTDATNATATATFSLTVAAAPTATQAIASKALATGVAATSFTPVTGAGGTTPLAYTISPALPTGLAISSSTGAITGTPSGASSSTTYTVTVTDANSLTATNTFSMLVAAAPTATQVVASKALTNGVAATSFTPVTGSGGTAPLAYTISPALPAGLAISSSTGAITGTPTATSSTATYTVTVTDANALTATATFSLSVAAVPAATQAVSTKALTNGAIVTSFTPVTGSGGAGSLVYSISPALPAGLAISSSTGAITGTPTATASAATYTVTVTDVNNAAANATFSLTVNAAVTAAQSVATKVLTNGAAAASFTPVTGGGGTTPLAYSISPTLPAGLSLSSSTGAITGTPTASLSATTFTVTVTDANSATASNTFSLTVNGVITASQAIATKTLISNVAATSFTPVTGGGGTGSLTYTIAPALPAGLAIASSTGAITGTPTATSSATTYTVTVSDANSATATATFSLTVAAAPTATLAIATKVLISNVAVASFTPVTGSGGTGSLVYSISPALPTGLTIASSTGAITGTPTATSSATTYTVTVTDANSATATKTFSLTVAAAPTATQSVATKVLVNGVAATSFTPVTGGGGTGSLTYTISPALPAGLAISSSTGAITGTPSAISSATTYTVTVTDANSATATATFSLTVNAPPSNVATLSAMAISSGTLSPNFSSGTTSYTASVTNATSSITVTPTVTQANATVTVAGNAVASGSASGSVTLNVGANTINTIVTAQDGTTTQTYAVVVTRAALLAQASFTVNASPTTLNATTTSSTLSTSGGSGAGAVTYAMTAGSCTVSGTTASAGTTSSETCTVTATKASDGTYAAATATVNITVARRANIAAAATDASVLAIHGAQIMQSQKFVTTQIDNVANHLNGYRNNFNLRPSTFGFGVNIQMPSLGPASQALYKIKDELTPRPEMQAQNKLQSKDAQAGMKKVGYVEEQDLTPYNDYLREEELAAEKAKQKQEQEQKALQEQIDQSQYYAANSQYERENLTYSVWTAGTIDYANYKTGDNKETQNKLTANGLTMGIDYKLHDAAIVGAAVGVGTAWQSAVAINTNLKAKQTAVTGYGMFGFADHWVVEGLMGYGVVDFSGNRTTSDGAAQLGVNRKGETLFSSGTISKMYWVEGYKVTPFARQDVMHINLHSYAETGAADYALGFDGTNFVHTTTSGGLQVSRDIFLEGAKLTPTAKIALNRIRTGGLAQNIYYADTGAAGGVYTLNQSGSYMTTQTLGLGLVYTTRAGDGFDLGWQGAIGANQYKLNGLRFAVRFAM